jgi:hypothetical protein
MNACRTVALLAEAGAAAAAEATTEPTAMITPRD